MIDLSKYNWSGKILAVLILYPIFLIVGVVGFFYGAMLALTEWLFSKKEEWLKVEIKTGENLDNLASTLGVERMVYYDIDKPNNHCYWAEVVSGLSAWVEDDEHLRQRLLDKIKEMNTSPEESHQQVIEENNK